MLSGYMNGSNEAVSSDNAVVQFKVMTLRRRLELGLQYRSIVWMRCVDQNLVARPDGSGFDPRIR